jgi:hypothetical protein
MGLVLAMHVDTVAMSIVLIRSVCVFPVLFPVQTLAASAAADSAVHSGVDSSSSSRMDDPIASDLTNCFIAHIQMKSLVLMVPPGAAAIAQRVVSRYGW